MSLSVPFAVWIAWAACALAVLACALTVRAYFLTSRAASRVRSTLSMQGELVEMHETLARVSTTLKRVAGRQAAFDQRHAKTVDQDLQSVTDKAELRRRVGLVPGKPAPHA